MLTRNFGMHNLEDNPFYKTEELCEKMIYPTKSDLSSKERDLLLSKYQIDVKNFP